MSKNNHKPINGRSASPFYTKICFCLGIGDGIKKDGHHENAQNGNPPKIIDPLSDLDDDSINPVNEIGRLMREIAKRKKKEEEIDPKERQEILQKALEIKNQSVGFRKERI